MIDYDPKLSEEIVEYAKHLRDVYQERDNQAQLSEDMFLCRWADADKYRKKTKSDPIVSADPRNAAMGVIRIMNAGDAVFSMKEQEQPGNVMNVEDLVKAATLTWKASSKIRGRPLQRDLITSGILHAEYAITIDCTADLLKGLEDRLRGSKKGERRGIMRTMEIARDRMEEVAKQTPYLFDVVNPRTCYPAMDKYGLSAILRRIKVTKDELEEMFGEAVAEVLQKDQRTRFAEMYLNDFYDLRYRQCWLDSYDKPLLQIEHELPFIPFVSHMVEGGGLFDTPEDQRQGFLFTIQRSGIWGMDNLSQSVIYKNTFDYGASLKMKYTSPEGYPDQQPVWDFDAEVPHARVPYGAQLEEMRLTVIPPELLQTRALAEQQMVESTIYKQVFGAPLSGNPSYSLVTLLNQTGRQALIPYIASCGEAMAEAAKKALLWNKLDGNTVGRGRYKVSYQQDKIELRASDIPDDFSLDAKLELELPQDKLGQSQVAAQLVQIGLNDKEYIREEVQGIEDSEAVEEKIASERAFEGLRDAYIMSKIQEYMQSQQPQQPAPGMQQPPGMQGPPGMEQPPQMNEQTGAGIDSMAPPVEPMPAPMAPGQAMA